MKRSVKFLLLAPAPVADFTGTPLNPLLATTITFTDTSLGSPTSWLWEYKVNAGSFVAFSAQSTSRNPSAAAGTLFGTAAALDTISIRLTATNGAGSNAKTQASYIQIADPG